jgi:hypothetical protein
MRRVPVSFYLWGTDVTSTPLRLVGILEFIAFSARRLAMTFLILKIAGTDSAG